MNNKVEQEFINEVFELVVSITHDFMTLAEWLADKNIEDESPENVAAEWDNLPSQLL